MVPSATVQTFCDQLNVARYGREPSFELVANLDKVTFGDDLTYGEFVCEECRKPAVIASLHYPYDGDHDGPVASCYCLGCAQKTWSVFLGGA